MRDEVILLASIVPLRLSMPFRRFKRNKVLCTYLNVVFDTMDVEFPVVRKMKLSPRLA